MAKAAKTRKKVRGEWDEEFSALNRNAAGIDVGNADHYVAVPNGRDPEPVRMFGSFTSDLHRMAQGLKACRIETVVMQAPGVYWIALFQILENYGFQVNVVNARHTKTLPGRKTDVLECQWLQKLHTFGLLNNSFRPPEEIQVLRTYLRQRETLVTAGSTCIQHRQKTLTQMNVQLANVISDISGVTGMPILRAIVCGRARHGLNVPVVSIAPEKPEPKRSFLPCSAESQFPPLTPSLRMLNFEDSGQREMNFKR